jgi:hypothetical protein
LTFSDGGHADLNQGDFPMRRSTLLLVIATAILPQVCVASDVGFQLEMTDTAVVETSRIDLPGVEIKDRVWTTPGIEETSGAPASVNTLAWSGPVQKFRIEPDVSAQNHSYLYVVPQVITVPSAEYSFVDKLWPLTREIFRGQHIELFTFNLGVGPR